MSLAGTNIHPGQLAFLTAAGGGSDSYTLSGATLFVCLKLTGLVQLAPGESWYAEKNGNVFAGETNASAILHDAHTIDVSPFLCIGDGDVVSIVNNTSAAMFAYFNGVFWAPWS